ncbi:hypothetical protein [Alteribacter aurantiacus]|uniref:hypothetical protein n=1 Tax=Alteribacter aurantiacus TaxID=254410 RepID=UPI00041B6715|nr:hypothetical protein [Alteribacter aurantiacus]
MNQLTIERVIAFVSHVTGHGASVIRESKVRDTLNGGYEFKLGLQHYTVLLINGGKTIQLSHSLLGISTRSFFFKADDFTFDHDTMNKDEMKVKEDLREEIRGQISVSLQQGNKI